MKKLVVFLALAAAPLLLTAATCPFFPEPLKVGDVDGEDNRPEGPDLRGKTAIHEMQEFLKGQNIGLNLPESQMGFFGTEITLPALVKWQQQAGITEKTASGETFWGTKSMAKANSLKCPNAWSVAKVIVPAALSNSTPVQSRILQWQFSRVLSGQKVDIFVTDRAHATDPYYYDLGKAVSGLNFVLDLPKLSSGRSFRLSALEILTFSVCPAGSKQGCAQSGPVVYDPVLPTLSIQSPAPLSRITSNTVVVKGTAADNRELAGVYVRNKTTNSVWVNASGKPAWQAEISLQAGNNSLEAVARDSAGNEMVKNLIVIKNTPGVSLTLNVGNGEKSYRRGQTVHLTWKLTNALAIGRGKLWAVRTDIPGSKVTLNSDLLTRMDGTGYFDWTIPEWWWDGEHKLYLEILYVAGKVEAVSIPFTVSGGSAGTKSISLNLPAANQSFKPGQTAKVAWSSSGIEEVVLIWNRLKANGESAESGWLDPLVRHQNAHAGTYDWTIPGNFPAGKYLVQIFTYDPDLPGGGAGGTYAGLPMANSATFSIDPNSEDRALVEIASLESSWPDNRRNYGENIIIKAGLNNNGTAPATNVRLDWYYDGRLIKSPAVSVPAQSTLENRAELQMVLPVPRTGEHRVKLYITYAGVRQEKELRFTVDAPSAGKAKFQLGNLISSFEALLNDLR